MSVLRKTLIAGLAALTLTAGVATSSAPAAAWYRGGYGWGAPVAAGVIGGLAAGAIIGSAARPYYGYPAYAPEGGCYLARRPTYDGYGNFIGYRRMRVCD
jgi:hypothetical protein